jgi:hypothetical protein
MLNEWRWWLINWLHISMILSKYIHNWYVQSSCSWRGLDFTQISSVLSSCMRSCSVYSDSLENEYTVLIYIFLVFSATPFQIFVFLWHATLCIMYISYYLFHSVPQDNMKFLLLHENIIKRMPGFYIQSSFPLGSLSCICMW